MSKTVVLPLLVCCLPLAGPATVCAQGDAVSEKDLEVIQGQTADFFRAIRPSVVRASASTVELLSGRAVIGRGTVSAPGRVLAKWSDVKGRLARLTCRTAGRLGGLPAVLEGIHRDEDLAVLKVEGLKAPPVTFAPEKDLQLGSFLVLARPDGEAGAMGVVSVLPRNLRETDRAFLGIEMNLEFEGPGVLILRARNGTAAAEAGLRSGDVITGLDGRAVSGSFELSSALQRMKPGQVVALKYRRGERQLNARVKLGGREEIQRIPWNRMEQMNRMGGHRYSELRDGFQDVIQSDMPIRPEDCGSPVVDLAGDVVGIAIARAGRIKSYILPAEEITGLIGREPEQPTPEELAQRALDPEEFLPEGRRGEPLDTMRRHMEDMRRLLEQMEQFDR